LIDKPLADTVQDAAEIIRLARSNGALLMSGAPISFSPEVATLRELATNGSLGKVVGAVCVLGSGVCTLRWYIIHMLDALSRILGPGIDSVYAMDGGVLRVWEREVPQTYGLVIHWRDGRLATVLSLQDLADAASNNPLPERCTKILYPAPTEVPPYIANHIRITVYGDADWSEAILKGKGYYLRELNAFLKMIRTGKEPIPLEQTLETIQAMDAAARSLRTHRRESIAAAEELLGDRLER
jgi:predicted dehydrogenase